MVSFYHELTQKAAEERNTHQQPETNRGVNVTRIRGNTVRKKAREDPREEKQ